MIIDPCIRQLYNIFPSGWISSDWNFNAAHGTVQIPLRAIDFDHDIPKVVLAAAAWQAAYGQPFLNPIRNWLHRCELQKTLNRMLGTRFSQKDFELMGQVLDFNNVKLIEDFIMYGCQIDFLRPYVEELDPLPA